MSKTVIFCADGTWNNPDQDENKASIFTTSSDCTSESLG
jgi:hypothetical protein